jgi:hypothetical protein
MRPQNSNSLVTVSATIFIRLVAQRVTPSRKQKARRLGRAGGRGVGLATWRGLQGAWRGPERCLFARASHDAARRQRSQRPLEAS